MIFSNIRGNTSLTLFILNLNPLIAKRLKGSAPLIDLFNPFTKYFRLLEADKLFCSGFFDLFIGLQVAKCMARARLGISDTFEYF